MKPPVGVSTGEFTVIADPPNVITGPVFFFISPIETKACDFFRHLDCLQNRTIAKSSASNVIHFSHARGLKEFVESMNKVRAVEIVPFLFALVPIDSIRGLRG